MGTVVNLQVARATLNECRATLAAVGQDAAAWWAGLPVKLRRHLCEEARLHHQDPMRPAFHRMPWEQLDMSQRGRILRAVDELRELLNDKRRALL